MAQIPKDGFLKITSPPKPELDSVRKAALIRKGNQLFNEGDITMARKIFLAVGYSDGISRVGDYFYKKSDYWEAYRLYKLAPAPEKIDFMIRRMAGIIQGWIRE